MCIGLGYGQVLRVDADVWGAEVNTASKLGEEMAAGGEVLVTAAFRDAVPQQLFTQHGTVFGGRPAFRWTAT